MGQSQEERESSTRESSSVELAVVSKMKSIQKEEAQLVVGRYLVCLIQP